MTELVEDFIKQTKAEETRLGKQLDKVAEVDVLHAVLSLFDFAHRGRLMAHERKMAQGVLIKMHTMSAKGLVLLHRVLTYLDVNENQMLEHPELTLALEILDLFCRADSVNDTLSVKELEMLVTVLERMDTNMRGVLDEDQRTKLRDELWAPDEFLARVQAELK